MKIIDVSLNKNYSRENVFSNKSFTNEEERGFIKDTYNDKLNKNSSYKKIDTMEKLKQKIASNQRTSSANKDILNSNVFLPCFYFDLRL